MYRLMVCALAFAGYTVAHAQAGEIRDPSNPNATVPAAQYRSAFADYRAYEEPGVAGWRELNEAVRAAGGHVGLTAKPPAASNDANPARAARPQGAREAAPGGHAGHH